MTTDEKSEGPASVGPCPSCGSTDVAPLLYGEPTSESFQAWERGDLGLGSSPIEEDAPAFECRTCNHRFGRLAAAQPEWFSRPSS